MCEKGLLICSADTDKYIRTEILKKSRTLVTLSLCAVSLGSFIIKLRATGDIIESVNIQLSCEIPFFLLDQRLLPCRKENFQCDTHEFLFLVESNHNGWI